MNKGRIIFGFVLVAYMFVMMAFVDVRRSSEVCSAIKVSILDSMENRFVESDDIIKLIASGKFSVVGQNWADLPLENLESYMNEHPSIKVVECYRTVNNQLQVDVLQRKPIARIIDGNKSYYLDHDAEIMPLSNLYSAHVVVVTGHLTEAFVKTDIYKLVSFLDHQQLWSKMFLQIDVATSGDITLIPRAGNHEIILGKVVDLESKFNQLEALYREKFNTSGWNRYKTINLKYKGQIVCTKK